MGGRCTDSPICPRRRVPAPFLKYRKRKMKTTWTSTSLRNTFYFILFYFILFYIILYYIFYFILFYFILFYFILFYMLFYYILFYIFSPPSWSNYYYVFV